LFQLHQRRADRFDFSADGVLLHAADRHDPSAPQKLDDRQHQLRH
jgi:hypothetical protein